MGDGARDGRRADMGRKVVYSVDMAAKRGRPFKGEAPRDVGMRLRLSEAERAEIRAACDKHGCSVTDLLLGHVRGELCGSKKTS